MGGKQGRKCLRVSPTSLAPSRLPKLLSLTRTFDELKAQKGLNKTAESTGLFPPIITSVGSHHILPPPNFTSFLAPFKWEDPSNAL